MHENKTIQPVILIGAARSGTRIVRDTIALHPAVSKVPYDINFIWRLGNEDLPHDELEPASISDAQQSRIQQKFYAFDKGTALLIEKTVSNCLRIPFVDWIIPGAKYIHLTRNGWDTIESAYRQWTTSPDWGYIFEKARSYPLVDAPGYAWSYASTLVKKSLFPSTNASTWGPRYAGIDEDLGNMGILEVCAIQWQKSVSGAYDGLSVLDPDRYLTIRYEDFVNNPSVELERSARFLGIEAQTYVKIIDESQITNIHVGKGADVLTEEQQETISSYIAVIDERYSYTRPHLSYNE